MSEAYHINCMLGMKDYPDNFFDIAVPDPPYFKGLTRFGYWGGKKTKMNSKINVPRGNYDIPEWDEQIPDQAYLDELIRVSKHQIIWGINYFDFIHCPGRIIWDKCTDGNFLSDAEIASCTFHNSVKMFRYMWNGMLQGKSLSEPITMQGNKKLNEKRIHPTQKPVNLYKWIYQQYAKPGDKILDTHLGSGSSRIAAYDAGLDFVGFEINKVNFENQEKRFFAHESQQRLFKGSFKPKT